MKLCNAIDRLIPAPMVEGPVEAGLTNEPVEEHQESTVDTEEVDLEAERHDAESVSSMTVVQLRKRCKELGLAPGGRRLKQDLVDVIVGHLYPNFNPSSLNRSHQASRRVRRRVNP